MRVALAAVLAAVLVVVRTMAPFVSAVHSSVTLPLEPVSTPSAFTTAWLPRQWMCGIAADPNGISNRQFFPGSIHCWLNIMY